MTLGLPAPAVSPTFRTCQPSASFFSSGLSVLASASLILFIAASKSAVLSGLMMLRNIAGELFADRPLSAAGCAAAAGAGVCCGGGVWAVRPDAAHTTANAASPRPSTVRRPDTDRDPNDFM